MTLDEAVEEALCFGWVDGLLRRIDDRSHALRFTPRKPASQWSASNKARVERLTREGRMAPAGLGGGRGRQGERRLGRADLARRPTRRRPTSRRRWPPCPRRSALARAGRPSHRRAYVVHVLQAKRPETRARRIDFVVRRAAAGMRPGDELRRDPA